MSDEPKVAPEAPPAYVSSAVNDFAFRLLRALTNGSGGNTIVSPLSVSMALAMTYNGAAATTKSEMAKTLAIPAISDDDFNHGNHAMLNALKAADSAVEMEIANALWAQSGFSINPNFLKLNQQFYDAPVESLDFEKNPKEAGNRINAWVDKNTHGKIPEIIKEPERNTRLVLTDAVYFKGRWTSPFSKQATKPRAFHLQNGGSVDVPMMTQRREYAYLETGTFQAIRLPYGNERFAMYVFLPREINGLPELVRSLDIQHWNEWSSKLVERKGTMMLPRFETTYGKKLNDGLEAIGMRVAFDPDRADFSMIHPRPPQLFISDVEHKTYVKVDEEGTEAAAATSVTVAAAAAVASPPPFQMIVDHPFFFAIAERQSHALLFAGIVTDPTRK